MGGANMKTKMKHEIKDLNLGERYSKYGEQHFKTQIVDGQLPSNQIIMAQLQAEGVLPPLKKINNQKGKEKILGEKDERQPVKQTTNYPYSAIGLISMKFGDERSQGTGFLIEKNLVLTCAHNCFDKKHGQASKMSFHPGFSDLKGERYEVKNFYYPKKFETLDKDDDYDFAILQLNQQVGDQYGTLGIDFSDKDKGEEAFIYGYPGCIQIKGCQISARKKMYGMKGRWLKQQNQIRYEISTSKGQSGSPVLITEGGKFYVIAIHLSSADGPYNYGLNLDTRVQTQINQWISKRFGKLELDEMKLEDSDIDHLIQHQFLNLKYLSASSNRITIIGAITILSKFPELQHLNLSENIISALPAEISQLTCLQQLWICGNLLTSLPPAIGSLINLKILWVSYNQLAQLPIEIGNLSNLQVLSVSFNQLKIFPTQIKKLKNLNELWAYQNNLKQLPNTIGSLKNLKQMSVSYNKLKRLPEQFGQLTNLTFMEISHNHMAQLPNSLVNLINLEEFNFQGNPLSRFLSRFPQ